MITIHNLLFRTMMRRFEARAQDCTVPATFLRASLKIIPLFERTFYNFGWYENTTLIIHIEYNLKWQQQL